MKTSDQRKTTRRDIHAEITNSILAAIEEGADSFRLPWHRSETSFDRPRNAVTQNTYNGVNILALWAAVQNSGFTCPLWATYRQWQSIGAQVRKGEQASPIVFYKSVDVEADNDDAARVHRIARSSRVFNADQVDGFEIQEPTIPLVDGTERLDQAEALIAASGADIRYGGDKALYQPSKDCIRIPNRERFMDTKTSTATESYYATILHELTHWTGHKTRCDRDLTGRFGNEAYAMEELIADLGAAFLCSDLGITSESRADHAAYLSSWLEILENDSKAIFAAASKASEAANYLSKLRSE